MKREILFRGKRIDNGEWIYGCCGYGFTQTVEYIMPDMFFATRDFGEIDKQGNPKIENEIAIGGYFAVDPKTVGQFTGLIDKNSKKIFEGDIIKTDLFVKNHFISFGKSAKWGQCFCVQSNNSIIYLTEIYAKSSDIIGDLHSNPELLDTF